MTVTHNVVLVVNGITLSMQGDLASGKDARVVMDSDDITIEQQQLALQLMESLGKLGKIFGETITSLTVTAI